MDKQLDLWRKVYEEDPDARPADSEDALDYADRDVDVEELEDDDAE